MRFIRAGDDDQIHVRVRNQRFWIGYDFYIRKQRTHILRMTGGDRSNPIPVGRLEQRNVESLRDEAEADNPNPNR